jgi:FtsH-binding integral membrane protein
MSTRNDGSELPVRRIDRILAYMALGLTVLSIVCFFAVILARPLGVDDFSAGLWPLVVVLPLIALPIAFVMIVVLLIMSFVRRSRANKGA